MEALLLDILALLKQGESIDAPRLAALVRARNENVADVSKHLAKKRLFPFYLRVKTEDPARWSSWKIDADLEKRLLAVIQMKPRRTASGVATITVITKPWPCGSDCLYCPNDVRMPKSYLSDEPACQRAERNFFDPYLQVLSRLHALREMGHPTDKIELIVLGGTWCDYPEGYRIWFIRELFRALNDPLEQSADEAKRIRERYRSCGVESDAGTLAQNAKTEQERVTEGEATYNQAVLRLYGQHVGWRRISTVQTAAFAELESQHRLNECAKRRVVGLVIETRPENVTAGRLTHIRRLGCTKIQMGIQSLDKAILHDNNRAGDPESVARAFALARAFGFKIHAHMMANLYGASPESDLADYRRLTGEAAYRPDEVKLYPCALVDGTGLVRHFADGTWRPYEEDELIELLTRCVLTTPPFIRISRMIRDISARDIMAGNRKTNLRQLVEAAVARSEKPVGEIRYRELSTRNAAPETLELSVLPYRTANADEHFLQWTMESDGSRKIAGFLRLSLPHAAFVCAHRDELPAPLGDAMIREVHVYGKMAQLHDTSTGAQHLGLGRRLVEEACTIARNAGYHRINVISAVGTRAYYRNLGFTDCGLYQSRKL